MPIINLSNPINILVTVVLFLLILLLSRETKRSGIMCILLLVFSTIISVHCIEYVTINDTTGEIVKTLTSCIIIDFVFIFLTFISYLWMDDIESKERKIKSIDNSLDWFWKKV